QMRKMLDSLSDRKIDRVIDLANMFRIDTLLEKFGDLDFQGRSLIPMMRYPATIAVVGYFVFSYLTSSNR
ncbi:MAG: hypothetical protein NWF03_02735, partial [Candidatus Bathyarchaeota archaeon]|nr:hypothetical protein [Candidatus Bathyarchaeota archaeon]